MGVEFREGSLIINSKNKKLIEEGMVFNLSLGFNDLLLQSEPKDKKKKNYALLISDTVIVNSNGPEIITKCKVNYSDIAYFLEVFVFFNLFYFYLFLFVFICFLFVYFICFYLVLLFF